jgi:uncharacterized protein YyaL (SSP411 family)
MDRTVAAGPSNCLIAALALAVVSLRAQAPSSADVAPPVQQKQNRLAAETSPYLRQHASNPVDWYPWGKEALARAKKEDKPIFLSIGYAACHWCHVMEHECFDDPKIAAQMNAAFVCIKVDREERPDLDEIYMAAVQAMTGQGGWPMSVWLTPDLQPFYGGTYFPPEDRYGRPGFPRVLDSLAKAWKDRRQDVLNSSKEITAHLQQVLAPQLAKGEPGPGIAQVMAEQSHDRFDELHGGFAGSPQFAPKFPHASELQVLLRLAARGAARPRAMAALTLDRMHRGGMFDHLGGGFHRYSTDREWLVPHFEKMLYDNALLVPCYLEAKSVLGEPRFGAVARHVLDYMLREMRGPHGGFYSSQDADSEGVEGKFFVWQQADIDRLLGKDAPLVRQRFGVTEHGNWEHSNVLTLAAEVAAVAKSAGVESAAAEERLEQARAVLFAERAKRVHPGTDDKVLTAWNGMAIAAMAQGAQALLDERYLQAAQKAADFVLRELCADGRCKRSWHSGKAQHSGYLEDYGFLADGLLTLFETDFDPRWLAASKQLLDAVQKHFRDPADGNFFFTADDHEELLARTKSVSESSTPSGTAMVVRAMLRAGLLLGDEALYEAGLEALRANHAVLERSPVACPSLVLALQFHQNDPREVVIAGDPADPRTQALLSAVRGSFPASHVVAVVHDGNRAALAKVSKVFDGKVPVGGAPAAYVCRRGVCEAPVTDPAKFKL